MHRVLAALLLISSFGFAQLSPRDAVETETAMKVIHAGALRAHTKFLSDDLLQGRDTGSVGYDIAAAYVASQMEAMGLKPGAINGSWFQPVPIRLFNIVPEQTSLELVRDGKTEVLEFGKDYVHSGDPVSTDNLLEAAVVFVGYGITAPEFNYDDYAGLDVKGKAVVVLEGAPANVPAGRRAQLLSEKMASAVAHGAVGLFRILTPQAQRGAPWERIVRSVVATGGTRWLEPDGKQHAPVGSQQARSGGALLSREGATRLFAGAPKSFDQVFADIQQGRVDRFALPVTIKMHTVSKHTQIRSANVIGVLAGSDPKLSKEYVVYTAHFDGWGVCRPASAEKVCHGAQDNASGTAALLEAARAFAVLRQPPRRSILFAFVTAEERGLLGSDYFANHPTVAPESIVANINIDGAPGIFHVLKDVFAIGADSSSLGTNLKRAATRLGLEVSLDPMPEQGFLTRGDQYPFMRRGVPAIWIFEGTQVNPKENLAELAKKWDPILGPMKMDDPRQAIVEFAGNWFSTVYHTPKDDMNQPFNFEAAVKGTQLEFLVGYDVAQQEQRPSWNASDLLGRKFGAAGR